MEKIVIRAVMVIVTTLVIAGAMLSAVGAMAGSAVLVSYGAIAFGLCTPFLGAGLVWVVVDEFRHG